MMFCPNCGKELSPNATFCGGCGSPVPQQNPQDPAPKARKSRKMALLAIPAAVIAAVLLAAFHFTALAARIAPDYALNRGIDKLSAALEKQADSSIPSTLLQYWDEGAFIFSGELEDPENSETGAFSGTLLTAQGGREFMLQDLTLTTSHEQISPFSFYLSGDALAVSSRDLTGDTGWYGFYLNRPLAEQCPSLQYLFPELTESIQHQLDAFSDLLNNKEEPRSAAIAEALYKTVRSFLDSAKPSVSTQTVRTGTSGSVKATVLTYRFDTLDLSILAGNLFDVLLEEDNAAYLANSSSIIGGSYYMDNGAADWISDMKAAKEEIVSSLCNDMEDDLILQFALGSDGALIQVSCTGSFENQYSETMGFECTLSFGANPSKSSDMDFNLKLTNAYHNTSEFSLTSVTTSLDQLGGTNQTVTLKYTPYDSGENSIVLSTDWNPSTNEFSTSLTVTSMDNTGLLIRASGTLETGIGTMDLDVDEFSFSSYNASYGELQEVLCGSFQLNAQAGSSIHMPEFENLFDHLSAF